MKEKEPIVLVCYSCRKRPLIFKSEDPAEIDKRYGVKCPDEECKVKTTIYGPTKTVAIDNWNQYCRRLVKDNLSSFN